MSALQAFWFWQDQLLNATPAQRLMLLAELQAHQSAWPPPTYRIVVAYARDALGVAWPPDDAVASTARDSRMRHTPPDTAPDSGRDTHDAHGAEHRA